MRSQPSEATPTTTVDTGAGIPRRILARVLRGSPTSRYAKLGGLLIVLGLATAWTIWRHGEEFLAYRWSLDPAVLLVAFALFSIDLWLATLAWHLACTAAMSDHDYRAGARIYLISLAARRLPIGAILGAGTRVYLYQQMGHSWRSTATALTIEWTATATSGALVGLTYVLGLPTLSLPIKAALIVGGLLLAVVGQPLLARIAARQWQRIGSRSDQEAPPTTTAIGIVASLRITGTYALVWIGGGLTLFAIAHAVAGVPPSAIGTIVGVLAIAGTAGMLVVVLPSGFGVVEITTSALLAAIMPVPAAVASAVIMRLVMTVGELVWAGLLWKIVGLPDSPLRTGD